MSKTNRQNEPAPTHAFICGLHRSGTSVLNRMLQSHPEVTGFSGTGASEDEGQHLQSVIPHDGEFGGPGEFCFNAAARLTEADAGRYMTKIPAVIEAWEQHWDRSCRVRLEKSPPNLVRSRFLQAMFAHARFIFIVRHPIVVSMATRKWSSASLERLIEHWVAGHRIMLADIGFLNHAIVVRYEDLALAPEATLDRIFAFLGLLPCGGAGAAFREKNSAYWDSAPIVKPCVLAARDVPVRFGYAFEPPYVRHEWLWQLAQPDGREDNREDGR